jgi:hypothetical protein
MIDPSRRRPAPVTPPGRNDEREEIMENQANDRTGATRHGEPARRVIASYDDYAQAEAAVDYLADRRFPVERVAIVGRDVRLVEQVTGRMTFLTAALNGAAAGALPGALVGWLFGLFDWVDPLKSSLLLALYGLIFGAVVGGLLHVALYAMQGGRRDFAAVAVMQPTNYDIVVHVDVADQAARELESRDRSDA